KITCERCTLHPPYSIICKTCWTLLDNATSRGYLRAQDSHCSTPRRLGRLCTGGRCFSPKTSRPWECQSWHIGLGTISNNPGEADRHSLTICFTPCQSRESRKISAGLSNCRFRSVAVCAWRDVVRGIEPKQRGNLPALVHAGFGLSGLDSAHS